MNAPIQWIAGMGDGAMQTLTLVLARGALAVEVRETFPGDDDDRESFVGIYDLDGRALVAPPWWELAPAAPPAILARVEGAWSAGPSLVARLGARARFAPRGRALALL